MAAANTENTCIGIDLGTTYSCVGVWQNDSVHIIANDQGARTTPSWVAFDGDKRFVGQAAVNQSATNPANTIFDAKRLIGRLFDEPSVRHDMTLWPFEIAASPDNKPLIKVAENGAEKLLTPEEVSAMILTEMKETAERFLGFPVRNAVITVPAYFNDSQRTATKHAGAIAGLNVMRIINEPTAAAIAYGLDTRTDKSRTVLIFDLGGGTFDVSILTLEGGIFTVKATAGNTHLGGEDFDQNMVEFCVAEIKRKNKIDISTNARSKRRLRSACERAKRVLSAAASATIEVDGLLDGEDFELRMSRAKFEDLNAALFTQCLEPVAQVLADAKMAKTDIDEIVLVGGSTRIPRVQELLSEFFGGKTLNKSINPDEAVAYGAAVQGAILTGQGNAATKDLLLLDVTPLSLGVDSVGNVMSVVIPRNTTIPCRRSEPFTTVENNQTSVTFNIYEGERPNVDGNHKLGTFDLHGIPPAKRGEPQITVIMDLDANGILTVTAVDEATKKSANVVIQNAGGRLSASEIERMIEEAKKFADQDRLIRQAQEARRNLEEYIYRVRDTVAEMPDLKDDVRENVEEKADDILAWLNDFPNATINDIQGKQKEMETAYNPVISKILKQKTRR